MLYKLKYNNEYIIISHKKIYLYPSQKKINIPDIKYPVKIIKSNEEYIVLDYFENYLHFLDKSLKPIKKITYKPSIINDIASYHEDIIILLDNNKLINLRSEIPQGSAFYNTIQKQISDPPPIDFLDNIISLFVHSDTIYLYSPILKKLLLLKNKKISETIYSPHFIRPHAIISNKILDFYRIHTLSQNPVTHSTNINTYQLDHNLNDIFNEPLKLSNIPPKSSNPQIRPYLKDLFSNNITKNTCKQIYDLKYFTVLKNIKKLSPPTIQIPQNTFFSETETEFGIKDKYKSYTFNIIYFLQLLIRLRKKNELSNLEKALLSLDPPRFHLSDLYIQLSNNLKNLNDPLYPKCIKKAISLFEEPKEPFQAIEIANLYFTLKDFSNARSFYEKAFNLNNIQENHLQLSLQRLVHICKLQNDIKYQHYLQEYCKILEQKPELTTGELFTLANTLYNTEEYEKSKTYYNIILERKDLNLDQKIQSYCMLINIYQKQDNPSYNDYYAKAIDLIQQKPFKALVDIQRIADYYFHIEDYEKSLEYYNKLLEKSNPSIDQKIHACLMLKNIYQKQNDPSYKECYSKAIDLIHEKPFKMPVDIQRIADHYFNIEDYEKSKFHYKTLLERKDLNTDQRIHTYLMLKHIYKKQNNPSYKECYSKAIDLIHEKPIKIPVDTQRIADYYFNIEDYEKSKFHYKTLLERKDLNTDQRIHTYLMLKSIYQKYSDPLYKDYYSKAIDLIHEKPIKIPVDIQRIADYYFHSNDYQKSKEYFLTILELTEIDQDRIIHAYRMLGRILLRQNSEDYKNYYKKTINLIESKKYKSIRDCILLADSYFFLLDYKNSETHYRKIVDNNNAIINNIIQAYYRIGEMRYYSCRCDFEEPLIDAANLILSIDATIEDGHLWALLRSYRSTGYLKNAIKYCCIVIENSKNKFHVALSYYNLGILSKIYEKKEHERFLNLAKTLIHEEMKEKGVALRKYLCYSTLANIYYYQKDYKKAEPLYLKCLEQIDIRKYEYLNVKHKLSRIYKKKNDGKSIMIEKEIYEIKEILFFSNQ